MYLWGMDQVLSASEFKEKLQNLHEERGITTKLRTHLRKLILSELQTGPTSRPSPPITLRARALGTLIVEWLQIHECHYTLSVLASEIPSLSDLPGLLGEGDQIGLKKEEVDQVLTALEVKSQEIIQGYENSTESLLSCVFKIASAWKGRLKFKELPASPGRNREGSPAWCIRLQDIITSASIQPDQLPSVYSALYSLIHNELDSCIASERQTLWTELVEREKKIKDQLKRQEETLLTRLLEAEQGLCATQEKASEEIDEQRHILRQLMAEVNNQHQAVVDALIALEERERNLEAARKVWKDNISFEKRRQNAMAEELTKRQKELDQEKEILLKIELQLKEKIEAKQQNSRGTSMTPPKETTEDKFVRKYQKRRLAVPVGKPETSESGTSDSQQPKALNSFKEVEKIGDAGRDRRTCPSTEVTRSQSPIKTPPMGYSSQESAEQSSGATSAAWRRLNELREETKRGREAFDSFHRTLADSDSSLSDGEDKVDNLLGLLRVQPSAHPIHGSQVTFPNLHEGCHPVAFGYRRRQPRRHRHLFNHGDQPQPRRSNPLSRIPRLSLTAAASTLNQKEVSKESPNREASKKMRQESTRLQNLLLSAREYTPYQGEVRKTTSNSDNRKFEALLKNVGVNEKFQENIGTEFPPSLVFPIHSPMEEISQNTDEKSNIPGTSGHTGNKRNLLEEQSKISQLPHVTTWNDNFVVKLPLPIRQSQQTTPKSPVTKDKSDSLRSSVSYNLKSKKSLQGESSSQEQTPKSNYFSSGGAKFKRGNRRRESHSEIPLMEFKGNKSNSSGSSTPVSRGNQIGDGPVFPKGRREINGRQKPMNSNGRKEIYTSGAKGEKARRTPDPQTGREQNTCSENFEEKYVNNASRGQSEENSPGYGKKQDVGRKKSKSEENKGKFTESTALVENCGDQSPSLEKENVNQNMAGSSLLMQAMLENASDPSEAEILSVGRTPQSPDNFWS